MRHKNVRRVVAVMLALFALALWAPAANAAPITPGAATIVVPINDSEAGVNYELTFERAYAGTTEDGTPVYIYVPVGALDGVTGVEGMDPQFDPNPLDEYVPCAQRAASEYTITQEQIDILGDQLTQQIVRVDEEHFGEMGGSDALVVLAYNVQDEYYYDCAETVYTAGYFASDYLTSVQANVIVIDTLGWEEDNIGSDESFYSGVLAHELEHLLMNYSDADELSWVDEGLADFAFFLNDMSGLDSHLAYQQVFHRETSLTRWGGGLENYGAAYTFFQYLWERAGGNGDDSFAPDLEYDGEAGDLLIKLIFEEQANGMEGVQNAINTFNAMTGANLESAEELYKDWAIAVYLDNEDSDLFDIKAVDFGDASWGYTISIANELFFNNRGIYRGAMPEAKWQNFKRVPPQTALPYGVSYETFRNPGPTFSVTFEGEPFNQIAPHTGTQHWYGGYESMANNILDVNLPSEDLGGQTIDFWTWYFIEEGWDYGFVEALVNGAWVTIPLTNDAGQVVTTDDNPHENNEEGNGLTGTSGGTYFVDEPEYIHLSGTLPAGTTDVRFRYSTDQAYLDTGWFVDDISVGGTLVADTALSSPNDGWIYTEGKQENNWVVQLISPCDLTPDGTIEGVTEIQDGGYYVYRLEGDSINQGGFSTKCLKGGTQGSVTAVISNLPTGIFTFFDADYVFRVNNTANRPAKR